MNDINIRNRFKAPVTVKDDDVIDLYELWLTIWGRRKLIIAVFATVVLLTAAISLIMTPIYRAETTVIPLSTGGKLGGLSDIASLAGLSIGGKGDDTQKIMAVLNSRTIKELVIKKMNLINEILDKIPDDRVPLLAAIEKFEKKILTINADKKTNLITVTIDHSKPELAQKIANTYIEMLQEILITKTLVVNKVKREFLEKQMRGAEDRMSRAQRSMVQYQKRSKMLDPKNQAGGAISLYTELVAQKTALEIKHKSMESALAKGSPILNSLEIQMKTIDEKLKNFEGSGDLGVFPSLGSAPDKLSDYADAFRELEVSKAIYTTVLKLYEQAKMEEAHEGIYVQIIDEAIAPDKRHSPKRTLMVAVSAFTALFFGIFIVFFLEWLKSIRDRKKIK